MKLRILMPALLACAVLAAGLAHAERADSTKQTVIDANSATMNDVTQVKTLIGNVIVARGTLLMKAGRATMKSDPEGYMYFTFFAEPGALATFRQKRDGGDIWDEGEAERIEYDNKSEIVKMFSKAKVTTVENKRKTQEVQGPYLSFDSRKEVYALENDVSGTTKANGGRVRLVIEAKPPAAAPAVAPAPVPATPVAPAKKP